MLKMRIGQLTLTLKRGLFRRKPVLKLEGAGGTATLSFEVKRWGHLVAVGKEFAHRVEIGEQYKPYAERMGPTLARLQLGKRELVLDENRIPLWIDAAKVSVILKASGTVRDALLETLRGIEAQWLAVQANQEVEEPEKPTCDAVPESDEQTTPSANF